MKKTRNVFALFLAMVICIAMCAPAFAIELTMDNMLKTELPLKSKGILRNVMPQSINKDKTFGLSPQTGEYEVLTDANFWKEDIVTVSLVSTQGPNPVKIRIYTKNSDGTYSQQKSGNVTFESPVSCNVNGAQFKVTAEYVDGITGNCTLNINLT